MNSDRLITRGTVIEIPRGYYRVKLHTNGHELLCKLSGRMSINNVRVILDDRVDVELSPYDLTRGRIIYRHK